MEITGIVLTGGQSTRMGYDKAFLELGGLWLVERVAKVLSGVCREIIIAGGNQAEMQILGYPVVPDIYPGCGPLSGIHAGLKAANHHYSFISACDTPFIDQNMILKIMEGVDHYDAAIMKHQDFYEPLFSLYSKAFIPAAEIAIKKGEYRVRAALSLIKWKPIIFAPEEIPEFDKKIFNINTPMDYQKAKKMEE